MGLRVVHVHVDHVVDAGNRQRNVKLVLKVVSRAIVQIRSSGTKRGLMLGLELACLIPIERDGFGSRDVGGDLNGIGWQGNRRSSSSGDNRCSWSAVGGDCWSVGSRWNGSGWSVHSVGCVKHFVVLIGKLSSSKLGSKTSITEGEYDGPAVVPSNGVWSGVGVF